MGMNIKTWIISVIITIMLGHIFDEYIIKPKDSKEDEQTKDLENKE